MWQFARFIAFGGVLAAFLAVAGTDEVLAQKKQPAAKSEPAMPADYILIEKNKDVSGTIVSVSGGGKSLILRVDTPTMAPNPNYKATANGNKGNNQQNQQMRLYQDIQRQMQQANFARTPQQKQQAMRRLQTDMARLQQQMQQQYMQQMKGSGKGQNNANSPFTVVHHLKDYEFELQEAAVLRKTFLPTEFDDVGNLKEYTEKVKAELRGTDKTKPGYMAKSEELVSGAEATLYLVPPKAKKKADKDDDGVGNVDPPFVRMVILTKESAGAASTAAPEPKKKAKK